MTKKHIIIGVVAAAGGLAVAWKLGLLKRAIAPASCGPGSSFHRWSSDELSRLHLWSPAVQAQVRMWGGTCNKKVDVDSYTDDDDSGSDEQDSYLITRPSQLG